MLRVRMTLTGWTGGPGLSTFYFGTPLEDTAAATRCIGYVQACVGAQWKHVWPTGVTAQVLGDVDVLTAGSGAITETLSVTPPEPQVGSGSGEYAPIATALLARLTTAVFIAGRRLRGRIFFCPVADNMVQADGTPAATAIGFINAGGAGLLEDLDEGDSWVVWHRPKSGSGGQIAPIVSVVCPDKFAILRSRRD